MSHAVTLTPEQFAERLRFEPPATLERLTGRMYLDATTQFHAQVSVGTPVHTGYLLAGFSASTETVQAPRQRKRARRPVRGQYEAQMGAAAAQVGAAIGEAARTLAPITMGFQANYAPWVEQRKHMLQNAVLRWPQMVESAVKTAQAAE